MVNISNTEEKTFNNLNAECCDFTPLVVFLMKFRCLNKIVLHFFLLSDFMSTNSFLLTFYYTGSYRKNFEHDKCLAMGLIHCNSTKCFWLIKQGWDWDERHNHNPLALFYVKLKKSSFKAWLVKTSILLVHHFHCFTKVYELPSICN